MGTAESQEEVQGDPQTENAGGEEMHGMSTSLLVAFCLIVPAAIGGTIWFITEQRKGDKLRENSNARGAEEEA